MRCLSKEWVWQLPLLRGIWYVVKCRVPWRRLWRQLDSSADLLPSYIHRSIGLQGNIVPPLTMLTTEGALPMTVMRHGSRPTATFSPLALVVASWPVHAPVAELRCCPAGGLLVDMEWPEWLRLVHQSTAIPHTGGALLLVTGYPLSCEVYTPHPRTHRLGGAQRASSLGISTSAKLTWNPE